MMTLERKLFYLMIQCTADLREGEGLVDANISADLKILCLFHVNHFNLFILIFSFLNTNISKEHKKF